MLPRRKIAKLRYGSIIYAEVTSSDGTYNAGAHWCVIVDADDAIRESASVYVIPISNNQTIDRTFLVPIPPRTGLQGNIVCSWFPEVAKDKIEKIHPATLDEAEMLSVEEVRHKHNRARPFG